MNIIRNIFRWIGTTLRLLTYNKVGFVGFLGVVLIVLLSFVGPYIWPIQAVGNTGEIFEPPSALHWLGTDDGGKDNWIQIVNGGKNVIFVALIAAIISTLIAITFGA